MFLRQRARHRVRFARARDVPTLAALGRQTFIETFGHLYPPEDLAEFLEDAHHPGLYAYAVDEPRHGVWIAEADGEAVGYALAGPCTLPHPDASDAEGELKRLYLLRSAQGHGLGTRLLRTSLEWLERQAPGPLWVGVWSENYGAQRLYAGHGFEPVGEYQFSVGATRDREFIYRRGSVKLEP
jgi:ribosomal protein S18 acetylase RimI-like enzyme